MDVVANETTIARWLPIRLRGLLAGAFLASGMTALAAPPKERAAYLLPPVKLEPGEYPAVARGAMDDLPGTPVSSTPVLRRTSSNNGPAWVSGVDPNVIPAAGFSSSRDKTETKAPLFGNSKDIPPLTSPKLATGGSTAPQPLNMPRTMDKGERFLPHLNAQPEPLGDPNNPFRGTASNGAPVMAGPPAYRWYGYGSVTPGSNQYAPNGQYPKGSANWYGVTGATPGSFPVPVVNPYRSEPGNEPPTYVSTPPMHTTVPAMPVQPVIRPNPVMTPKQSISTGIPAMPPIESIGTATSPTRLPPLPQPIGVPVLPKADPVRPITGSPVSVTKPAALPPAMTSDPDWKQKAPAMPPPNMFSEPGAHLIRNEITARGQMPDSTRDPAAELIQGMCKGRASGVDVRWTAGRKLMVCFEVKTAADATRLVTDISARRELAPFAIDFCALVK